MVIQCTNCLAKFKFDEKKIKGRSAKVKCTKCASVFTVIAQETIEKTERDLDFSNVKATASHIPTGQFQQIAVEASNDTPELDFYSQIDREPPSTPMQEDSERAVTQQDMPVFNQLTPEDASSEDMNVSRGSDCYDVGTYAMTTGEEFRSSGTGVDMEVAEDNGEMFEPLQGLGGGESILSDEPMAAFRPEQAEQVAINEDFYANENKTAYIAPKLDALEEIVFSDTDESAGLLLDDSDSTNSKNSKLNPRLFTGKRIEHAPVQTDFPFLVALAVKGAIFLMAAIVILVGLVMFKQGDRFDLYQLSPGYIQQSLLGQLEADEPETK